MPGTGLIEHHVTLQGDRILLRPLSEADWDASRHPGEDCRRIDLMIGEKHLVVLAQQAYKE